MLRLDALRQKLEAVFLPDQAMVLSQVITEAYTDLVKTSDFNELKEIVRQLGVKTTELAEAQKRTEQRVEELAQAQKRTEQRVEELAEAQKRTEEELRKLVADHRETRRQLGGLALTVGCRLEDEAMKALPRLLERDHGITVQGRLTRRFVRDNQGADIEVNIFGRGLKDGQEIVIVGESKSQLSKNDVDNFIKRKLRRLKGTFPHVFPVLVTYMVTQPEVEAYAPEKGIALYYSYDF